jgi:CelD/BcsL family acetyltransferase involved in cellulose biosynthesis
MRIECIASDADMPALLPEWTALWRRVETATPFQFPGWLMAWWRRFGSGMPRILTARVAGELVGVLPLYRLDEPGCRKLLPIGIGLSDYIDALVDPALVDPAQGDVAGVLLGAIGDVAGWQECHIPDLPSRAVLAGAPGPAGCGEERHDGVPCPVLQLPPSAAGLAAVVPRKTLRDARQAAARSDSAGGAAIEAADPDTVAPMMEDLFRLHEARWRSRGEGGAVADPAVREFHRDAARALGAAGMLRLYRLRIGDAVAAVYYGFARGGASYAYLGGFDPATPRQSPGAQIMLHAIGEAIAEGRREFHFLRGGERYKYAWGARDRWNSARRFRRP